MCTGSCSQREIFDAYMADQEAQRMMEALAKKEAAARKASSREKAKAAETPPPSAAQLVGSYSLLVIDV